MYLKSLELLGFKSFAKKSPLEFSAPISAIVGPNGSGKSNIAEAFRFVLGEQSIKSLRGKRGEDLIWNGSKIVPRGNRGSVKLVFDNEKRLFNVDFDEVSLERVVYRDGTNEYLINGTQVRLRDIIELLAGANVGVSGHHIISQGEADRVLSAGIKERRDMIEDALGLKVYQYKKEESEKKLGKTRENITQVESLRKEIAPHLRFLEKQVEKVNRVVLMREELTGRYLEYLAREELYIALAKKKLEEEKEEPSTKLAVLEIRLQKAKTTLEESKEKDSRGKNLVELEEELARTRSEKETFMRELGRLEGEIAAEKRVRERKEREEKALGDAAIPLRDIDEIARSFEEKVKEAEGVEDAGVVRKYFAEAVALLRSFIESRRKRKEASPEENDLERLLEEKKKLEGEQRSVLAKEESLRGTYEKLRRELADAKDEGRDAERELFEVMAEQSEMRLKLQNIENQEQVLVRTEEAFKSELSEGGALIGRVILDYKQKKFDAVEVDDRLAQEKRRRELEKLKIRLEEAGGGSAEEILKEHAEVKERDAFLEKEVGDLERSAASLEELIAELDGKLNEQFKEGLQKINTEFERFFSLMFGGGTASLLVVEEKKRRRRTSDLDILEEAGREEEEEVEEGIDITVSLPHKRIKGLQMLSGGERALTSIALIFAMSQVNPPPFIILDETDAALDEANSKRYGDMIENLSRKSQLILITHNRETMSRAGILYGITMGSDGISKLLSVRFEEAVAVAK